MPISFNEIPSVYRVPGNYQEIDNSLANTAVDAKSVLLIGQKAPNSKAASLKVYEISDKSAELYHYLVMVLN